MKCFFLPREIIRLTGVTYRKLQYWDKRQFISPSNKRAGKYRLYTFSDVVLIHVAKKLRENKVSMQSMYKTILLVKDLLPKTAGELRRVTLMIDDRGAIVFEGRVTHNRKSLKAEVWISIPELADRVNEMFPNDPLDQARVGEVCVQ